MKYKRYVPRYLPHLWKKMPLDMAFIHAFVEASEIAAMEGRRVILRGFSAWWVQYRKKQ